MAYTEHITVSDNVRAVLMQDEMADDPFTWGNTSAVLFTVPERYTPVPEVRGDVPTSVEDIIGIYSEGTGYPHYDVPLPTMESLAVAIVKTLVRQGLKPERKRLVGYSQGDLYEGIFWNPDGHDFTDAEEFGAWAFGDVWIVHYEYSPTGLEEDYEPFGDDNGFMVYYGSSWDIKDDIINDCPPAPTYTSPAESPKDTLYGLTKRQMREVYEHQSQRQAV